MENIENAAILKAEIKSILACKAKDGATFRDVKGITQFLVRNPFQWTSRDPS